MAAFTFKRGIHPPDHKESTNQKPIKILKPIGDLVFPMAQHIGAPCEPIVKKGDRVLLGQKIADSEAFVSSPIFSSVSGTVKSIEEVGHPNGFKCKGIVIENDHLYEDHPSLNQSHDYKNMTNEEILAIIKNAGIVGMGGATFPTHIKLAPPPDKEIDFIILNGAECEPYLTSDHRIMLEETDRLIAGLKVLLSMFKEAKGIIGIESNKPDAIKKVTEAAKDEPRIEVITLHTKYPQGAEKQLIYAATKREVPPGKLPFEVGCIVQNVDTIVAIHRAVDRGRPLTRRIVTVTGDAIKEPQNFKVRLGTSYKELIEAAGGFVEEPAKIISGGPMMGFAMYSMDVPIIKGSSSILCLTKKAIATEDESNCMRCGKCVSACPMGLMPFELNKFALAQVEEEFEAYKGMDCMECGACSYVCPSKRHLLQSFRTTKKNILTNRRKS
ncbi:MAG: electron transport complex subunit RsxC [Vallitaleaceae bacterium]|nr:electron transport complex subunit RsxC [Vallitaleaceae bacterium]